LSAVMVGDNRTPSPKFVRQNTASFFPN
jgi:hypothetical protein